MVAREDPAGILVLMPSDHVIKDEPGFVAAVRRAAEVAAHGQARAVRHHARARRTPATATSAAARRSPASPAPMPSTRSPRSPTRTTAAAYLDAGDLLLEQRHLRVRRARLPGGAGAPRARDPGRPPSRRSPMRSEDLGFLRLDARGLRAGPRHLHRLCRDGAHGLRRRAAGRHRLERCRLLVVAVGARRRATPTATPSRATRCWRPRRTPTSIPSGRSSPPSASRTSSSSTRPTRCWSPTAPGPRTCRASSPA